MTKAEKEVQKYIEEVEDIRLDAMEEATSEGRRYAQLIIAAVLAYKIAGKSFRFSDHPQMKETATGYLAEYKEKLYSGMIKKFAAIMAISIKKNKDLYGLNYDLPSNISEKFLSKRIYDETTRQRLSKYVDRMLYEIEAYVAAGINASLSEKAIIQQYAMHILKPFSSPVIQKAVSKGDFNAIRLAPKGVHFGSGDSASAIFNIRTVAQDSLQNAFQEAERLVYESNGIIGYTIHRGSSFDCPICNYLPGKIYPITEWILPAHNRCCCFSIPIIKGE